MVGLLVVTHGRFSRELIKSIELIIGHQKTVEALTLEEGDDVNKLREEVEKKTEELDQVAVQFIKTLSSYLKSWIQNILA